MPSEESVFKRRFYIYVNSIGKNTVCFMLSFEGPDKNPLRWKDAYLCRTAFEADKDYKETSLRRKCDETGYSWGDKVFFRLHDTENYSQGNERQSIIHHKIVLWSNRLHHLNRVQVPCKYYFSDKVGRRRRN